jgi:molecular chaperone GrpE (heat shock protein)
MPSKKQKPETATESAAEQKAVVSNQEFEALKTQLAEAQAKADEYLDGWKRALADFDNYKKRIERDRVQDIQNIKADIIKHFLPVVDDLELALQNRPSEPAGEAWAGGIELILRKLQGKIIGIDLGTTNSVLFAPSEMEGGEPVCHPLRRGGAFGALSGGGEQKP